MLFRRSRSQSVHGAPEASPEEHADEQPDEQEASVGYRQRCNAIASKSQTTFLYTVTGSLAVFVIWAMLTELDQVTRGAGEVVPQSDNQIVQHLEGGIVTDIFVRNGDRVRAGEPLMRIENSFSEAELSHMQLDRKANRVKLARLKAESTGLEVIKFEPDLIRDVPDIVARERELYQNRMSQLRERMQILDDQLRQKSLELSELQSRWSNTTRERSLVLERVQNLRRLADLGGVSRNDLLEAERTLQQIESLLSGLTHQIPRAEAAVSELGARRREALLQFRAEADNERVKTELELTKVTQTIAAMRDRNDRSDVVAPIAGVVNTVFITTVGGVVKSGQPLVELVASDASIAVEARLSPVDRARVWPGLPAVVKISAYDYSIFGGLSGEITEISPDAIRDEDGTTYFRVRLTADREEFGVDQPVVPGMVAEVDILTGRQSIMAYLTTPLRRVRENALRQ